MQVAEDEPQIDPERAVAHVERLWLLCGSRHRRSEKSELRPVLRRVRLRSPHRVRRHVREHLQLLFAGISVRNESVDQPSQPRRQGRSVSSRRWNSGSARSHSRSKRRASASTCATRCLHCSRRRLASMPRQRPATWRSIPSTSRSRSRQLGAKSSSDTLAAQHDLSIAESLLVAAQTAYEKAKVDIDRATGETLQQTGVSIDDAKVGSRHA